MQKCYYAIRTKEEEEEERVTTTVLCEERKKDRRRGCKIKELREDIQGRAEQARFKGTVKLNNKCKRWKWIIVCSGAKNKQLTCQSQIGSSLEFCI